MKTKLLLFIPCFLLLGHAAWAQGNLEDPTLPDPTTIDLPTLSAGVWASYCPSEKTWVPQKSNEFRVIVYTAYVSVSVSGDTTLALTPINTESEAYIGSNYGYLLKSAEGGTYHVRQSEYYKESLIEPSGLNGTKDTINVSSLHLQANDYLMVLYASQNKFVHFTGDTIPANKAFLIIQRTSYAPGTAPSIRIVEEPAVVTALDNSAEETKGVKILRNGQLYIRREGVTYDLMGRTIR